MITICPNCEKETNCEPIKINEEIKVREELISVPVEYFKCLECNDEFEDPLSDYDSLAVAYSEYRRRNGMMQPEEIKQLRKEYGLTQKELSKLLGWGEVTLSRYENGALQDATHNTVLQLIKEPHNLLALVKKHGGGLSNNRRTQCIETLNKMIKSAHPFPHICDSSFENYLPDPLSGFLKFNIDKFFQAALFFCKNGIYKTKLNKLLFYADFKHYKDNSVSITGARYKAIDYGPVPDNYEYYYYVGLHQNKAIRIAENYYNDNVTEQFLAEQQPDLSLFSNSEIETIIKVDNFFKDFTARAITDFSHKEKGYTETPYSSFISYSFAEYLQL